VCREYGVTLGLEHRTHGQIDPVRDLLCGVGAAAAIARLKLSEPPFLAWWRLFVAKNFGDVQPCDAASCSPDAESRDQANRWNCEEIDNRIYSARALDQAFQKPSAENCGEDSSEISANHTHEALAQQNSPERRINRTAARSSKEAVLVGPARASREGNMPACHPRMDDFSGRTGDRAATSASNSPCAFVKRTPRLRRPIVSQPLLPRVRVAHCQATDLFG
jgi:hypothetical protein